ncbi:MAG: translation initiation factor IF-6 [Methermicoccaceae archaeon]
MLVDERTLDARRLSLEGGSSIGVFARCTERYVLVRPSSKEVVQKLSKTLGVEVVELTLSTSTVVGSLACANSSGVVVTPHASEDEVLFLENATGCTVQRLDDKMTACGNIVVANDYGAVVHPALTNSSLKLIEKTLNVRSVRGTVGGLCTTGMAAAATNKGVLVHPRTTAQEVSLIEDVLNVPAEVGTVNFGSSLIGAGLIANTKGYLAGSDTTGFELGRIEKALGFV